MKPVHVISWLIILLFFGCKSDSTGPSGRPNLIPNYTFEVDGNPSLRGWDVYDSTAVEFSYDMPTGGLGRTIILHANHPINNFITTQIRPPEGNHLFRLSCWSKCIGWGGGLFVTQKDQFGNRILLFVSPAGLGTSWKFLIDTTTLNILPGDSLLIALTGGMNSDITGTTYFNTPKLEILDNLY